MIVRLVLILFVGSIAFIPSKSLSQLNKEYELQQIKKEINKRSCLSFWEDRFTLYTDNESIKYRIDYGEGNVWELQSFFPGECLMLKAGRYNKAFYKNKTEIMMRKEGQFLYEYKRYENGWITKTMIAQECKGGVIKRKPATIDPLSGEVIHGYGGEERKCLN